MKESKYRPRVIDRKIQEHLTVFGAVCIEGPKWCGKTWSARYHSKSEILIGSSDNQFQNRTLAELSPSAVLEGDTPRLIDEWQEVPSLWDAVRYEVDQRAEPGQFLLTGSATPNHKGIMHSGAGRISRIRMQPMSLYESGDSSGKVSLNELLEGDEWFDVNVFVQTQAGDSMSATGNREKNHNSPRQTLQMVMTGEVALAHLMNLIVRGGWPGLIGKAHALGNVLSEQYITAILEDDVFRIDGVKRDSKKMRLLLMSLARNESTTASNKVLRQDIKDIDGEDLHVETVSEYLDIFKRLFLTENQPPFSMKVRSSLRLKQSEKRHFVDPSLACALLGLNAERLIRDLETARFMFEAMCERDLRIYAAARDGKLYHYQDYANREIDAVIEMPSGDWHAFEIKLGANQIDDAAEKLLNLYRSIASDAKGKPPKRLFVICGMTRAAYQRPDGVIVLPITALRP